MPFPRGKKPTAVGSKIPTLQSKGTENQEDGPHAKRASSPPHGAPKKRTAFIDITNAHKLQLSIPTRKKDGAKKVQKKTSDTALPATNQNKANLKKSLSSVSSVEVVEEEEEVVEVEVEVVEVTSPPVEKEEVVLDLVPAPRRELPLHLQRPQIPVEFDVDAENFNDISLAPEYAKEIFDYLKQREEQFVLVDYMSQQPNLTSHMRATLVDWLVEVQENFELNHETLYLAVKMTDHYLSIKRVNSSALQLIGSTAMLIASKFEEVSPPCLDDFQYICDDAYKREELISMEISILQTLNFDISIPISYRFLRRYAKCVGVAMDTLTLARFVCELSLHEMDMVPERGSRLAAACLLLALLTKDLGGWCPVLQYHTGYALADIAPLVRRLHDLLTKPQDDKLRAVRSKYSNKVFWNVATIPPVAMEILDKALLEE